MQHRHLQGGWHSKFCENMWKLSHKCDRYIYGTFSKINLCGFYCSKVSMGDKDWLHQMLEDMKLHAHNTTSLHDYITTSLHYITLHHWSHHYITTWSEEWWCDTDINNTLTHSTNRHKSVTSDRVRRREHWQTIHTYVYNNTVATLSTRQTVGNIGSMHTNNKLEARQYK